MSRLASQILTDMMIKKYMSISSPPGIFKRIKNPKCDHIAILDIPSPYSGVEYLKEMFHMIGYENGGSGYIEERINDYTWLHHSSNPESPSDKALPQIVLADFRVELLSEKALNVINDLFIDRHHSTEAIKEKTSFLLQKDPENKDLARRCAEMIYKEIFETETWQHPTVQQYKILEKENPLVAWVLAWGRTINHCGIALHLKSGFKDFNNFMEQAEKDGLDFNDVGGVVKGSESMGIEQVATAIEKEDMPLEDAVLPVAKPFMEFVWRYSQKENPKLWGDYYNGFISQNANLIITSVAQKD